MSTRQLELTSSKNGFSAKSAVSLSVPDLSHLASDWLLDGQFRLHSPSTVATRRVFIKNLLWFLKERNFRQCGTTELKHFFV